MRLWEVVMEFLLKLHGEMRWLVALAGAAVLVRSVLGWARGAEFRGLDRGMMAAFTGLLDLNFLMGLVLLVGLEGGWTSGRVEHVTTMFLAVVAAHLAAMWRRSDDAARKFRNNLFVVAGALALVLLGVIRLRGGWIF
jgi:hypothetical protein